MPASDAMTDIAGKLADVKDLVAKARLTDAAAMPVLVAVSKRQPDERIDAAATRLRATVR